jgi:PAS domain S-box-containing protein
LFFKKSQKSSSNENAAEKVSSSLKNAQALSEIIINSIADGVVLLDSNKNIIMFNPGAEAITGWKQTDAISLPTDAIFKFVDEKNEPIQAGTDPFSRAIAERTIIRDTNANLNTHEDKKTIGISISVNPLVDQAGNITSLIGIFMDVSDQRQADSARAEFISTASHEMRTPVAAIEGYLALAMNDKVCHIDTKAREYLSKAHVSTQHLGQLFQDLLTSAKAEDGRLVNHPEPTEMGEFLEQLTENMRFTAEKKGLLLEYQIGANQTAGTGQLASARQVVRPLYYAFIDPDRMREVLTNLFDNAIKYTETGKVVIGITGDDRVVQIQIKDSGQGIAKEDLPHLFEKFYRVDNSATRAIGGTGLGLFICRKIVELYNGRIWVESEPGQGSTFYINLPRLTSQRANELQAQQTSQTSPLSSNV